MKKQRAYVWLLVICLFVPTVWLATAVILEQPENAGRGGAIGVALSFFFFFVNARDRYHAIDVVDKMSDRLDLLLNDRPSPQHSPEENAVDIDALKQDFRSSNRRGFKESIYLSISSAFSSILWGFGDWIALLFFH